MEKQLLPYQIESVKFLKSRKRAILALDCGLGKTLCALEAANYNEMQTVHVICPASLKSNWENEILKWGYDLNDFVIHSYEGFTKSMSGHDHPIISLVIPHFCSTLIVDESHAHLRNEGTKRVKAVNEFLKDFKGAVYFLTATPIVKGAGDLYNIMRWSLNGSAHQLGSRQDFLTKHCFRKPDRYSKTGWKYEGVKDGKALREIFNKCGIRFKKDEIKDQLPDRRDIEVSLDCGDFRLSEEETATLKHWLEKGYGRPKHLSKRQQEVSKEKIKVLFDMYGHMEKTVWFCWYRETAMQLKKMLGVGCEMITGSVTAAKRFKIVEDFQSGKVDKLVCTISACGLGLNMFEGENVIFAEFPWTYAEMEQCLSRVHRMGNKGCTVFYPVCVNSIEEVIWEKLEMRENLNLVI